MFSMNKFVQPAILLIPQPVLPITVRPSILPHLDEVKLIGIVAEKHIGVVDEIRMIHQTNLPTTMTWQFSDVVVPGEDDWLIKNGRIEIAEPPVTDARAVTPSHFLNP